MTRKEKIIEILNTYQSIIPPLHDEGMVDPMDFHKVADAIMAIPLDVPSEEELTKWVNEDIKRLFDNEVWTEAEL